jgi:hypothetical protein
MEIIIGPANKIKNTMNGGETAGGSLVEAKMLKIRPARRGGELVASVDEDRRTMRNGQDPYTGSVLMLLVPDSTSLPKDVHSGNYRVFLRFAKKA